jgi:hypothetical protein
MKNGKFINLGYHEDIKIGFGTIDFKNLKTIYIKFNSWLLPSDVADDFETIISQTRRQIKEIIRNKKNNFFRPQSIVDLDIKTKGIKLNKKSFMNLEITLYTYSHIDIKDKLVKEYVKSLCFDVIDLGLVNKNLFNFYKTKK